ncbi:MAG: hypothetical protein ACI9FD_002164 [Gammaproteobacteria bacterium]|jgi:hypothetical protein
MQRLLIDRLVEVEVNAFNGTIIPFDDHYWLIGCDSYGPRQSYLHYLDRNFQLVGKRKYLNQGQEDHRIILCKGTYHVWSTWADGAQMRNGILDMDAQTVKVAAVSTPGIDLKIREKNWCPFYLNDEIFVVYSLFPEFVVLRLKDGKHEKVFAEKSTYFHKWAPRNLDFPRLVHIGGGSNFVRYRNYFVGTFHAKFEGIEYRTFLLFFTPHFEVEKIVEIDYGDNLFCGERLQKLTRELEQDDDESVFFVAGYRRKLKAVAFSTGFFLHNDKFHISLGVNDLVTKVAIICRDKIDSAIDDLHLRDTIEFPDTRDGLALKSITTEISEINYISRAKIDIPITTTLQNTISSKKTAILVIAATNTPVNEYYIRNYWTDLIRYTNSEISSIDVFLLFEDKFDTVDFRQIQNNIIRDETSDLFSFCEGKFHSPHVPGILSKTVFALEQLQDDYDVFFRTNLSSLIRLSRFNKFVQERESICYSGAVVYDNLLRNSLAVRNLVGPGKSITSIKELDQYPGNTFISGSGFFLNNAEARLIVKNGTKIRYDLPDDIAIGLLLSTHEALPEFTTIITFDTTLEDMDHIVTNSAGCQIESQHFPLGVAQMFWDQFKGTDFWR